MHRSRSGLIPARQPLVAALLAGAILVASARLGEAQHQAMILSEGASTCGEYIAEPEKQVARMMWVLGYISGANSRGPISEAFAGSSFQMPASVIGWLQTYCASHPVDPIVTAAEQLRRDFLAHEHH